MSRASRPVVHTLDVYGVELWLCWTRDQVENSTGEGFPPWDPDQVTDSAGSCNFTTWQPHVDGRHTPLRRVLLWIHVDWHRGEPQERLVDTVAHEACHAALWIANEHGLSTQHPQEATAYLAGWITAWVWQHLPAAARRP